MKIGIIFVIVLVAIAVFIAFVLLSDSFFRFRLWCQDRREEKEVTRANDEYFRKRRGDEIAQDQKG